MLRVNLLIIRWCY